MKSKRAKEKQTEQKNTKKEITARKPLLLYFFIVCVLVGLISLIVSAVCFGMVSVGGQEAKLYIQKTDVLTPKDAAIVPGAAVYEGVLTAKAKDRLLAALQLYEENLVEQIIVSGGVEEIKAMTQYLMLKGIPTEDLASDEQGVDTYETLARIKEKYGAQTYYFCTQELYVNRAGYLMKQIGVDGLVICVDTMYYSEAGKSMVREYFAATKAVADSILYRGKPKKSIQDRDFVTVPEPEENSHLVYADELETPEDYSVEDVNKEDGYDVIEAVKYARTYALEENPEYPVFEQNCTNFVSQCLVAGGIEMQGEGSPSDKKRYRISGRQSEWYSRSERSEDGLWHYATSSNFINTNEFIRYFTEELGYEMSVFNNDYQGKLECYNTMASGDVLILFDGEGKVVHIGLITGMGEWNAYYCANTNNRLDFGAFKLNPDEYAQFGILHMSGKSSR